MEHILQHLVGTNVSDENSSVSTGDKQQQQKPQKTKKRKATTATALTSESDSKKKKVATGDETHQKKGDKTPIKRAVPKVRRSYSRENREPFEIGVERAARQISSRTHQLNPDMSISVQNIVASVQIVFADTKENVRLSHSSLVNNIFKHGVGCSSNSLAFQSIKIKTSDGTIAIFCHGELIFTGVTTIESTKQQLEMLRPMLPLNRPFLFVNFRILNIVYSFDTGFRLKLNHVLRYCEEFRVKYEPTKFPGCIVTLKEKDDDTDVQSEHRLHGSSRMIEEEAVVEQEVADRLLTSELSELMEKTSAGAVNVEDAQEADAAQRAVREASANSKVVSICFATGKGIITGCVNTKSALSCAEDLYSTVLVRYKDADNKPIKRPAVAKVVYSSIIPLLVKKKQKTPQQ